MDCWLTISGPGRIGWLSEFPSQAYPSWPGNLKAPGFEHIVWVCKRVGHTRVRGETTLWDSLKYHDLPNTPAEPAQTHAQSCEYTPCQPLARKRLRCVARDKLIDGHTDTATPI